MVGSELAAVASLDAATGGAVVAGVDGTAVSGRAQVAGGTEVS